MSEWHSYCRGEHPHSQAQLDPQARTITGVHTWLVRRVPPAKPWADDVLNEVDASLQDEIARLGGPQALEAIDKVDLSAAVEMFGSGVLVRPIARISSPPA